MQLNIFVHVPKCAGGTVMRHIQWEYRENERFRPHRKYKDMIARALSENERAEWMENPRLIKRSLVSKYLRSLSPAQREAIRCIYGHAAYYGVHEAFEQEPRYFTLLREPAARFVSYYNHMLNFYPSPERYERFELTKKDGTLRSLEEWLEQANIGQFSMTSFLAEIWHAENLRSTFPPPPSSEDLEAVKGMLKDFYFVGLVENDDDHEFTYTRLGITKRLPDEHVMKTRSTYIRPKSHAEAAKIVASRCPADIELYEYALQLNRQQKDRIPDYQEAVLRTRAQRNETRPYMQIAWSWYEWRRGLVDRVKRLF